MKVFVTGASGWVGRGVVRELVAAGHDVTGLARSDASADVVEQAGAKVRRGDLKDPDSLAAGAREADAVIHTAFIHDFSNFAASVETETQAIEAMCGVLEGSDRPFVMTSGIGMLAPGRIATEDLEPATEGHAAVRGRTETLAQSYVPRGVRVSIIRLPASVHGNGDHGFVPYIIARARAEGVSAYIGDGQNRWPSVHRDDAARAYILAMEKGTPGERFHPIHDTGIPFRDIAGVIADELGVPLVSLEGEAAAAHFGWMTGFASLDMPASGEITRARLGWKPEGTTLIENLRDGTYFDADARVAV